jgi:hypothetical protein
MSFSIRDIIDLADVRPVQAYDPELAHVNVPLANAQDALHAELAVLYHQIAENPGMSDAEYRPIAQQIEALNDQLYPDLCAVCGHTLKNSYICFHCESPESMPCELCGIFHRADQGCSDAALLRIELAALYRELETETMPEERMRRINQILKILGTFE